MANVGEVYVSEERKQKSGNGTVDGDGDDVLSISDEHALEAVMEYERNGVPESENQGACLMPSTKTIYANDQQDDTEKNGISISFSDESVPTSVEETGEPRLDEPNIESEGPCKKSVEKMLNILNECRLVLSPQILSLLDSSVTEYLSKMAEEISILNNETRTFAEEARNLSEEVACRAKRMVALQKRLASLSEDLLL